MLDFKLLKKLCEADGISGEENCIRDIIFEEIKLYADRIDVDNLGNIIAFKKGQKTPDKKLLLSAHMDEVGFIATDITTDGNIKFSAVGGINNAAAFAKQVKIGKNKICGVVNAKPIHLLKAEERKKNPSIDDLYIDIGAKDK